MAIINRTPDSFYDNGITAEEDAARAAIHRAVRDGADLVDIGGVPASPGPEVSVELETERVLSTIVWARQNYPDLVISVDTYRHEVAEQVCRAGADIINDNWAAWDPKIIDVAAEYGAGYVCAHTDGLTPRTDPVLPSYPDVTGAVVADTTALAERALERGVPREGILIDPAIDFSKNTPQSLTVLRELPRMVDSGWPVLMAMSNKGVVGETLDVEMHDRLTGTLAATALAAGCGAAMFRAHQVRETRQTVEMVASIVGTRPPARAERWMP